MFWTRAPLRLAHLFGNRVLNKVTLIMILYALEEILECLDLTRVRGSTIVIVSEFLLGFFQQNLENGMGKVTRRDDKPSKLRTDGNRQISFWNIG